MELICRLCHTVEIVNGHCCILAEGVLHRSVIELFASIMDYQLITFESSALINGVGEQSNKFVKEKLSQTYIDAGVRVGDDRKERERERRMSCSFRTRRRFS